MTSHPLSHCMQHNLCFFFFYICLHRRGFSAKLPFKLIFVFFHSLIHLVAQESDSYDNRITLPRSELQNLSWPQLWADWIGRFFWAVWPVHHGPRRWIDRCEAPWSPGILPFSPSQEKGTINWLLKQLLSEPIPHFSLAEQGSQIGVLNVLWGLNSCQWKCKWLCGEWGTHNGPAATRPLADIMTIVTAAVI